MCNTPLIRIHGAVNNGVVIVPIVTRTYLRAFPINIFIIMAMVLLPIGRNERVLETSGEKDWAL